MTLQVGVKIFLKNSEGKFLILKRSPAKYVVQGLWDIPGGRIDPGTELIENLRREVNEETQLQITSEPRLVFAQDIIRPPDLHVVRLTYTGEANGVPVLDEENTEFKWLSLEELRVLNDLDPFAKEVLDKNLIQ